MQSNDAQGVCRDFADWSGSVIADRAMESYAHFTDDFDRAQNLSALHCLVWRHLILDRPRAALVLRRELVGRARGLGVSPGAIDAIDRGIADDLLESVFDRFGYSQIRAADQARALLLAAASLAELRTAV